MENTFTKTIGNNTVLSNVAISWTKVAAAVPGFNGGNMQYELQISTTDVAQASAWKAVMPNVRVSEDGVTSFTLKRPAFQGRPNVVHADGALFTEEERKTIGNMSVADVRVSSNVHPKSGTQYATLEAVRVTSLIKFVPIAAPTEAFDF